CQFLYGRIAALSEWLTDLIQPFGVTLRSLVGSGTGQSEALEIHEPPQAFGTDTTVHLGNVRAHTVADHSGTAPGSEAVEQHLQIRKIVRKPVAPGLPLAIPETAPIRG